MSATLAAPAADAAPELFAEASRLHEAGRLPQAEAVLRRLLDRTPRHAGALNLLGITLGQQGALPEGAAFVEQAIDAGGENPVFLRNLCELRRQDGAVDAAVAAGRRAVAVAPGDRIARLNLAMAEHDALDLPAAEASTNAVLAAEPGNASAHFLRAQLALLQGDLAGGWREYGWRWRIPGAQAPVPDPARHEGVPEWTGSLCVGTLMVLADQGFGDMIQFVRHVRWARSRCDALVLCCPRELHGLFARGYPDLTVTAELSTGTDDAGLAAYTHLSSLPGLAGLTTADIPRTAVPYLRTDPARVQRWTTRLDQLAPGAPQRRIGLVWAGRPEHRGDRQRSMALADLQPLLNLPDICFVSLQKGPATAEIGRCFGPAPLVNLGVELEDFDDTAAVLTLLDTVVTVDTSVAHLAGAIGRPAHVLLPRRPDWRWLLGRTDTPWYPSLQLHRDPHPGTRADSVARLAALLAAPA